MFTAEYIESLPRNRLEAALVICQDYKGKGLSSDLETVVYTLEVLLEGELPSNKVDLNFPFSGQGLIAKLLPRTIHRHTLTKRFDEIEKHVKAKLVTNAIVQRERRDEPPLLSFEEDDIKRVDSLLSEIRNILRDSEEIEHHHKVRLLKVANDLQKEIDKPMSSYRVFLDGMIETSEVIGEAGENVKPVFDRINQIFRIVDKKAKPSEQIEAPEELPQLPAPESDNENT